MKKYFAISCMLFVASCGGGGGSDAPSQSSSNASVVQVQSSISQSESSIAAVSSTSQSMASSDAASSTLQSASSVDSVSSISQTVSSSAPASSAPQAASSSSTANQVSNDYCDPHTTLFSGYAANNTYIYEASEGNCFGIKEDVYQKKTVPLEVTEIQDDIESAPLDLKASSTVKISAVPNRIGGLTYYYTFEVSNEGIIPYCDLDVNVDIYFDNSDQPMIGASLHSALGDAYHRSSVGSDNKFREEDCISPGGKLTLYGAPIFGGANIDIDKITKASVSLRTVNFRYISSYTYQIFPSLTPNELIWGAGTTNSPYPSLKVSFMNPLSYPIRLDDDKISTIFFDGEGYVVGSVYVWLYEGLGKQAAALTESDYLIPAQGGAVLLADDIADIAAVVPSSAKKVMVFVEWNIDD